MKREKRIIDKGNYMKKTVYKIPQGSFSKKLCFAVVSDLHGGEPETALGALREENPDYILMPGDIFEQLDGAEDEIHENALRLLRGAAEIAPTFYSTGNHEDGGVGFWKPWKKKVIQKRAYSPRDMEKIHQSGVTFLSDSFVLRDGIAFGGLNSGLICEGHKPNVSWLEEFCGIEGPKILLSHHPEYYKAYLKRLPIDLIISGHAHGGQWRFFGKGVFAPGQGIFPKYTAGVHDDRLVISTGLKKGGKIPRFFNEPEIVFIRLNG